MLPPSGGPAGRRRAFQKCGRIPPRAPGAQSSSERPCERSMAFPERPRASPSGGSRNAFRPGPPLPHRGVLGSSPSPSRALGVLVLSGLFRLHAPSVATVAERGWLSESGRLEARAGRERGRARLTPAPSQYCVCIDDCSSSNCMCGQLSLRCWYDQVSAPRPRRCSRLGGLSRGAVPGPDRRLSPGRPAAARVQHGGAALALRVQPRLLLLAELPEPRRAERPAVSAPRRGPRSAASGPRFASSEQQRV